MANWGANHCVASYVDRIINGRTYIMFLRYTTLPKDSLITLELKDNKILQAKGSYNRPVTDDEHKFLEKYCKEKKIELCV